MCDIINGFLCFQQDVFFFCKELFKSLVNGQMFIILFIFCFDSCMVFELVIQCELGDLFVICNVGNIVLFFGLELGGVSVMVEYVVVQLKVLDIVICGYFDCGVMMVVVICVCLDYMLVVCNWLYYIDVVWMINELCYYEIEKDCIDGMVCENVIV